MNNDDFLNPRATESLAEAEAQPATAPATTMPPVQHSNPHFNTLQTLRNEIGRAVIGQHSVIEQVLACLLAGGHVLLEGVPGLGKTLLVRALAKTLDGDFSRAQRP